MRQTRCRVPKAKDKGTKVEGKDKAKVWSDGGVGEQVRIAVVIREMVLVRFLWHKRWQLQHNPEL